MAQGNNPYGFDFSAMAQRQSALAQGQLDYQKQSETGVRAQETQGAFGGIQALGKGIKGAKDLKKGIEGGVNKFSQFAGRMEDHLEALRGGVQSGIGSAQSAVNDGMDRAGLAQGMFQSRLADNPESQILRQAPTQMMGGESSGTIANMNPQDFSSAQGTIQNTLTDRVNSLSPADQADFQAHFQANKSPGASNSQQNLAMTEEKLTSMDGGRLPTVSTSNPNSRIGGTLTRAMGDGDGVEGFAGRNLPNLQGAVQSVRGMTDTEPLAGITQGATNLHNTVQNGIGRLTDGVEDAGRTLTSGLEKGIGMAEGVVDALGPVGDVIGLAASIFGGIKAHQEHKEEESSAEQSQSTINSLPSTQSVNASAVGVGGGNSAMATEQSHY